MVPVFPRSHYDQTDTQEMLDGDMSPNRYSKYVPFSLRFELSEDILHSSSVLISVKNLSIRIPFFLKVCNGRSDTSCAFPCRMVYIIDRHFRIKIALLQH